MLSENKRPNGSAQAENEFGLPPRADTEDLAIAEIKVDPDVVAREINFSVVNEYAEDLKEGAVFPPILVFKDQAGTYLLADGQHRLEAARRASYGSIRAEVRRGDRRAALLASVGANAEHGVRRTAEDKRRAVWKLLNDSEWSKWADRDIARRCQVSPTLVGTLRAEQIAAKATVKVEGQAGNLTVHVDSEPAPKREVKYKNKHGKEAKMNVVKIGKTRKRKQLAKSAPAPDPAKAIKACINTVRTAVELALKAKSKDAEHQCAVFQRVRQAIDEMAQARGITP